MAADYCGQLGGRAVPRRNGNRARPAIDSGRIVRQTGRIYMSV